MTEKLYYKDAYSKEIEAEVVAVSGSSIILDKTIFYPEGGGQPGDSGWFNGIRIIDTQKGEDEVPLHILEKGSAVPELGTKGKLILDWDHRYFYMQEHSAQHLVSALLFSMHGIGTVAVHQGTDGFTIETNAEDIPDEVLFSVEDAASKAIIEGHRIWQDEMEHSDAEALHMRRSIKVEGRVKIVHIEGIDEVACGGVHVSNTHEIGEIAYTGKERIRSHVRTMWKCGSTARDFRRQNMDIVHALSALFSAESQDIAKEAERVIAEGTEMKRNIRKLEEHIASLELDKALCDAPVFLLSDIAVSAYDSILPAEYTYPILVADTAGRLLFYGDGDLFAKLRGALQIKGGGRNGIFHGSFSGSASDFLAAAKEVIRGND